MGIRLECPNGHKLNVKESLAGRRGVCPDCGAKVLIPPLETSSASTTSSEWGALSTNAPEPTTQPFAPLPGGVTGGPSPTSPLASHPPDPAIGSPPIPKMPPLEPLPLEESGPLWYIRSAQGGQYGPATTDVVRHWISEGRVTADCWVWCTGWPDWKSGAEALPFIGIEVSPLASPPILPVVREPTLSASRGGTAQGGPLTAVDRQREKLNRRRRQRQITWGMTLLVIILAAVLIFVLSNRG